LYCTCQQQLHAHAHRHNHDRMSPHPSNNNFLCSCICTFGSVCSSFCYLWQSSSKETKCHVSYSVRHQGSNVGISDEEPQEVWYMVLCTMPLYGSSSLFLFKYESMPSISDLICKYSSFALSLSFKISFFPRVSNCFPNK